MSASRDYRKRYTSNFGDPFDQYAVNVLGALAGTWQDIAAGDDVFVGVSSTGLTLGDEVTAECLPRSR